jgi:hypothetical protein
MVAHLRDSSYLVGRHRRDTVLDQPGKVSVQPHLKKQKKKNQGMTQLVKQLSGSKHEALSSVPSIAKQSKITGKDLFFGDWGLNSGLCACKAGTLLLEPHLLSILFCYFRDELFALADLKL